MTGKSGPDFIGGNFFDVFGVAVEVVERHSVESDGGNVIEDLGVAVEAQRETADQILLGRPDFGVRRTFGDKAGEHFAAQLEGFASLRLFGLQSDLEWPRLRQRHEVAINAVGQAALFTHLLHQPRDKTAAAQRVVADQQGKEIGITPFERRQANQQMRLRGRMRDAFFTGVGEPRFGQRGNFAAGGQVGRQHLRQVNGLRLRDVADNRDGCPPGGEVLTIKTDEVIALQRRQGFRRGMTPVGMARVEPRPEGPAGNRPRLGQRFLEAGDVARFLALENFGRKLRTDQNGTQQLKRWDTLLGGGEGTQADRGAIHVDTAGQ